MTRGQTWCHHCGTEIMEFFEIFDHAHCRPPARLPEPTPEPPPRPAAPPPSDAGARGWALEKHFNKLARWGDRRRPERRHRWR
jgi:hypothetical protein